MSDIQYDKLRDALANLRQEYDVLKLVKDIKFNNYLGKISPELQKINLEKTAKNSVIKCFEICYEMMHTHLKKYLEKVQGIADVPTPPRDIYELAHEKKIITLKMKQQFGKYHSARNKAAHDYGKERAEFALSNVKSFIDNTEKLYQIMIKKQ